MQIDQNLIFFKERLLKKYVFPSVAAYNYESLFQMISILYLKIFFEKHNFPMTRSIRTSLEY